jgi:hypothetical protein
MNEADFATRMLAKPVLLNIYTYMSIIKQAKTTASVSRFSMAKWMP